MNKIAFVFPGQGSQYVGMGSDFIQTFPEVKQIMQTTDEVLGIPMSSLIASGNDEELSLTINSQPAILAVSYGLYKLVEQLELPVSWAAGHSIGEYAALVAMGTLSFPDALSIVRKRGELMQQAVAPGVGGMAAIIGLPTSNVIELCLGVCQEGDGIVEPAAFNSPEQTVVAGNFGPLEKLVELAKENGAKRSIILNVRGPFHSSILQKAGEQLYQVLKGYQFYDSSVPIVSNVTAERIPSATLEKELLAKQVSQTVRWEESIRLMIKDGVDTFIEIGPGKVLSGLIRRIDKGVTVFNTNDIDSWNTLISWAKRSDE